MEIYCKCGCGKLLSADVLARGGMFVNRKHLAKYRKGRKLGPYKRLKQKVFEGDIDYSLGKKHCKKYNNDDIKCVMCLEQNLQRECLER